MGYVVADPARRWPIDGIPYGVDTTVSRDPTAQKVLDAAVSVWNARSSLPLLHDASPAPDSDHIWFLAGPKGSGGLSQSGGGRSGGRQTITMDFGWELAPTSLLHEIGHAAGCIHEHQRPDRDDFVSVLPIPDADVKAHGDVDIRHDGVPVGPYDCLSQMHYTDDDPYVGPKQGACGTIAHNEGMTTGDEWSMAFLAGRRLQPLGSGVWGKGWTRFATVEHGGVEHLIAYDGDSGSVHFDRVNEAGGFTTTVLDGSWAPGWDAVSTFEVGQSRLVLVYDQGSGSTRIDRIHPAGDGSTTTATATWGTWTTVISTGLGTQAKDHVLVYNAGTGTVRLDRVTPDGTKNLWQEQWDTGFDSFMPYRLDSAEWNVLAYDRDTGRAEVRLLAANGSVRVFTPSWSPGWSHIVAIPTHPRHARPDAWFVAYNSVTGEVHLDRMHASSWTLERQDTWAPGWTHIMTPHLGRVIWGNTGLLAYNAVTGAVHTHLLMVGP